MARMEIINNNLIFYSWKKNENTTLMMKLMKFALVKQL
jgi:hypothetical protein